MAWTTPRTWVTNENVSAAIMNTHIRDNQNETGPAKVTTAGDLVYASAANSLSRLAIGTTGQFLKGGTAPAWSNKIEGTLIVESTAPALRLSETDAADPADYWTVDSSTERFRVSHRDDSAGTTAISTAVEAGDYILHTGLNGAAAGAVRIAQDSTATAQAFTTTGSTLASLTVTTGGPAWVFGEWNLRAERLATGSASDSFTILPRDDGANLASRYQLSTSDSTVPNLMPTSGDISYFSGSFQMNFTATNTTTWTLYGSASTNSIFRSNDISLTITSIQYPT